MGKLGCYLPGEQPHSDETLLRMIAGGDQEAFSCLYRRYWEPLFVTTVKVIRSKEDAADIVQEVFLSLWNRRSELSLTGSLAAYLQTSVRYKAIHYIEKNVTRRNYLEMLTDLAAAGSPPSAEALLQVKEIREAVSASVENMPSKMQTVYRLSRQEQLSHKEIAAQLGISEETVKKHIQHALHLIKTAIGRTSAPLTLLLISLLK
jgi:RNA polymerase sigma-70 factor (family 1)